MDFFHCAFGIDHPPVGSKHELFLAKRIGEVHSRRAPVFRRVRKSRGPAGLTTLPLCDVRQHAGSSQKLASALRMRATTNMRPSITPTICAVRLSLITADIIRLTPRSGGSRDHIFPLLVKHSGTDRAYLHINARDQRER